jgi:hypothetical protein
MSGNRKGCNTDPNLILGSPILSRMTVNPSSSLFQRDCWLQGPNVLSRDQQRLKPCLIFKSENRDGATWVLSTQRNTARGQCAIGVVKASKFAGTGKKEKPLKMRASSG